MPKRGMEAVASKQKDMQRELAAKLKRKPVMQRKGEGKPGMAVMIAIGKPKGEMGKMEHGGESYGKGEDDTCPECGMKMDKSEMHGDNLSKQDKVAALEEKIGYLKAELALLQDESDESDEMDEDAEDDSEDSENEDEE